MNGMNMMTFGWGLVATMAMVVLILALIAVRKKALLGRVRPTVVFLSIVAGVLLNGFVSYRLTASMDWPKNISCEEFLEKRDSGWAKFLNFSETMGYGAETVIHGTLLYGPVGDAFEKMSAMEKEMTEIKEWDCQRRDAITRALHAKNMNHQKRN